jgi:curved DNA-binding protein CbpA
MDKSAADTDSIGMPSDFATDYYEVLQISPNAELDTIHRVYRLLAQRFHPDNQATGDDEKFRSLTEAYAVLGDPEKRARYDVHRPEREQERSQILSEAVRAANDVEAEQLLRLTVLELLYAQRRTDPRGAGVFFGDLENLVGCPREHIEFALWYLSHKRYIDRSDGSRLSITADGVDYLEANAPQRRRVPRLVAGRPTAAASR